MRKFYLIAILFLSLFTALAGNPDIIKKYNYNREKPGTPCILRFEQPSAEQIANKIVSRTENAPVSILGKSYVTFYDYGKYKCNCDLRIKGTANDSIILEGFVMGIYDVKAKYDVESGKITIPTGMVIGKDSTYGDVTLYALVNPDIFGISTDPIVGIVDGNKISFNYGIVGAVPYEGTTMGIYMMSENVYSVESTGKATFMVGYEEFDVPLIMSKTSENEINFIGLSTIVGQARYSVPIHFNEKNKTAYISEESPVDFGYKQNTTYSLKSIDSNYNYGQLNFTVSASENETLLKATSYAGYVYVYGYDSDGKPIYGGFVLNNLEITVDYNVYTAKIDPENAILDEIIYKLDDDTKTAQVKGCVEGISELNIPSKICVQNINYIVNSIKMNAFNGNKSVLTIYLPSSLKNVGTDAFRNMTNLKNLYIEDLRAWCSVEFANNYANPINNVFPSLEKDWGKVYFNRNLFEGGLNIPDGVSSIGRSFCGLKSLKNINFPGDGLLASIGDQAFGNVTGLTEVRIPSSVRSVGSAFSGCENLTSVTLSEGLEDMGNEMFYRCTSLKEITIPSTVRSIGHNTFMSCRNITEIKSLSVVPPVCNIVSGMTPFDDFRSRATLRVPADAIEAYRKAAGWNRFANIVALDGSSGIGTVEANENTVTEYFNLQGQKVPSELLDKGIYIVRRGSKVSKVYVK